MKFHIPIQPNDPSLLCHSDHSSPGCYITPRHEQANGSEEIVPQWYDREDGAFPALFPRGFRGAEWSNAMLAQCSREVYYPSDLPVNDPSAPVSLSYYILPFSSNKLSAAPPFGSVCVLTNWFRL